MQPEFRGTDRYVATEELMAAVNAAMALLFSLYPVSRRTHDDADRRCALSESEARAAVRGARHVLQYSRDAGIEKEADHVRVAGLDQAAGGRGHTARGVARRRCEEADSAAARRAAQERAGRAPVRTAAVSQPPECSLGFSF